MSDISRQEAVAQNLTIDDGQAPIAYAGPRFNPTVWHSIPTELEEQQAERIKELESIAHSDDGAGGEGMKLFLENRKMRQQLASANALIEQKRGEIEYFSKELKRAKTALIERIATYFDAMPGREMFGGTVADEIRELSTELEPK